MSAASKPFRGFPVDARVGDGDTALELIDRLRKFLVSLFEIAFDHQSSDSYVARDTLGDDILPNLFLTTMLFLRSDPAMYMSPGRTYARVGVRDPARMYTYVAVFSFLHPGRCTYVYMLRARLYYDTCAPLLRHVRASTSTSIYVCTRSRPE
mgnify:CR=1 FL=1